MFKLNSKPSATYFWPVTVQLPLDGEKTDDQPFTAEFKRLTRSEVTEIEKASQTDADMVRAVLVGWRDVTDDGQDVPFSPEALAQLLDIPQAPIAVIRAFYESLTGRIRGN